MEPEENIYLRQLDPKIEIKQEPCFLETSTDVKSESEEDQIKNKSASFASDCIVQCDSDIKEDDQEECTKIEIKEEPIYLERTSTEMKCEPQEIHSSEECIKNESAALASDCIVQSGPDIQEDDYEICTEIEIKEEPIYPERMSTKEVVQNSEQHSKNESASLASDFTMQSNCFIQDDHDYADQFVPKIEIKHKPCLLGRASTKVTHSSEYPIKSEPASLASDFIAQSDPDIQSNDNEICTKIEIKEEPIYLERTSTEVAHSSEDQTKNKSASLASEFILQCECFIQDDHDYAYWFVPKIKHKLCLLERGPTKVTHSSEDQIKNESASLASDCIVQSNCFIQDDHDYTHRFVPKIEIKHKPCLLERASTKVIHSSEYPINRESASLASDFVLQSDSFLQGDDDNIHSKIEIKEEPIWLERTSNEVKSALQEIHLKVADLDLNAENYALQEDKESTEVTRLDTEAVRNYESGVTSDKVCLKLRENSSTCEKSNTFAAHRGDIHVGDTMPHKCKYCAKFFSQPSDLQTHIVTHEGEREQKCNVCGKRFIYPSSLKAHSLIHKRQSQFKCDKCDKGYPTATLLRAHSLFHEQIHKCNICDESFTYASHLKIHNLKHNLVHESQNNLKNNLLHEGQNNLKNNLLHEGQNNLNHALVDEGQKSYKYDHCKKTLPTEYCLNVHALARVDESTYKCDYCNKIFNKAYLDAYNIVQEAEGSYKCDYCNKTFNTEYYLKAHNSVHERLFKCDMCDKSFMTSSHLKLHASVHLVKMPHKCNICNKRFYTNKQLKRHILDHEKPHKCIICNRGFPIESQLKRHALHHKVRKSEQCNICNKRFYSNKQFKRHILDHEEPLKCNICNKSFPIDSHLKSHILDHEKPHKCIICKKRFPVESQLKRHALIHEGKQPDKCDICNKSFSTNKQLKRHILDHEKPHKCNICNKRFPIDSHLKRHVLDHEKAHKCNICDKSFPIESQLKRHALIHEGKKTRQV